MEWKIRTDDDREFIAPDMPTLKKWVAENRVVPQHYVFHPVLQRWMYVGDALEVRADQIATSVAPNKVVVTDLDMSFGNMVFFMVKWAIAAIPALIILGLIGALIFALLAGLGASLVHH